MFKRDRAANHYNKINQIIKQNADYNQASDDLTEKLEVLGKDLKQFINVS